MKTIWRVARYLKRYPLLALGTLLCAIFSAVAVVMFPMATKFIVDDVLRKGRHDHLLPIALLTTIGVLIQQSLNGLRIILNTAFQRRVIFDLRNDLYSHIQLLPLKWFDNRATGDLMTRILEDVNSVERVLIDGVEIGVISALEVMIGAAVMLYMSPKLTLLAMSPLPVLIGVVLWYTLTAHHRYRAQRNAASAMNSLLHDNLAGIRHIKSYVREDEEALRFNRLSDETGRATSIIMRAWAIYNSGISLASWFGPLLVLVCGAHWVASGTLQLGELIAFLMLGGFVYTPITRLNQLNQLLQAGRVASERVFEIIDEPPEPGRHSTVESRRFVGHIRFDDVSFSYGGGLPALSHVSFDVAPGQTLALVGTTGAGKSTVVNLLVRFYDLTAGDIAIDGQSIRRMNITTLRQNIAMVTQESFLFNGTIRDNLLIGKPRSTETELWLALTAANASVFVDRLPKKLDSLVGERGVKLSVGEKQRISIARAILKDPPILILDEATASVDTHTERLIQEALERLMAQRTSVVIAHRLSTIVSADQILVLEHGRVIERGNHVELMVLGGKYRNLCDYSFLDAAPRSSDGSDNVSMISRNQPAHSAR